MTTTRPQPLFSSNRERRLWLWAALVVLGIFSTLSLASRLAEAVRSLPFSHDLINIGYVACMLMIGVAILTQGLRSRPMGIEVGVVLGIGVVYLLMFLRLAITERSHLIEYSVVALIIYEALRERSANGRRVPWMEVQAILLTALTGALDEGVQLFLPSRVFDPVDILFNFLAGALAVSAMFGLGWVRSKYKRRREQT